MSMQPVLAAMYAFSESITVVHPHCRLSPQTSISNPCDPGDPGQVVRNPPVGHFLIPVNFGDPGKIY